MTDEINKKTAILGGRIGLGSSIVVGLGQSAVFYYAVSAAIGAVYAASPALALTAVPLAALWVNSKIQAWALPKIKEALQKTEKLGDYNLFLDAVKSGDIPLAEKRLKNVLLVNHEPACIDIAVSQKNKDMLDFLLKKASQSMPESYKGLRFSLKRKYTEHIAGLLQESCTEDKDDKEFFDFLLPYYKHTFLSNVNLLKTATQWGVSLETIKKIARYEDPKKQKSAALLAASSTGRLDVLAFLYPLSDPEAALKKAKKEKLPEMVTEKIRFIMTTKNQKDELNSLLSDTLVQKKVERIRRM